MNWDRAVVINAALGHWYPRGQRRLVRSLVEHGFPGEIRTFLDFPQPGYNKSNPYEVKASCFEQVLQEGFTFILWLDCSAWAIKPIEPIFAQIHDQGYYLAGSGYNAGQTSTDKLLAHHGITRDEAMGIPDAATGTIGIRYDHPQAKEFLDEWIKYAKAGMFGGSRTHNVNDSTDPRFLFSRQDQSAASLLAHRYSMTLSNLGGMTAYYQANPNPETCIVYKGM